MDPGTRRAEGRMSAIERIKREIEEYPIVPGEPCPPMLFAPPGAVSPMLIEVVLELIRRVEALEEHLRSVDTGC